MVNNNIFINRVTTYNGDPRTSVFKSTILINAFDMNKHVAPESNKVLA